MIAASRVAGCGRYLSEGHGISSASTGDVLLAIMRCRTCRSCKLNEIITFSGIATTGTPNPYIELSEYSALAIEITTTRGSRLSSR